MNSSTENNPFDPKPKTFVQQIIDRMNFAQKIKYSVIFLAVVSVILPALMQGAGFANAEPGWGFAFLITSPYWARPIWRRIKNRGNNGKFSIESAVKWIQDYWKTVVVYRKMSTVTSARGWDWLEVTSVSVRDTFTDVTLSFDSATRLKELNDIRGSFERLFDAHSCEIRELPSNRALLKIRYTEPLGGTRETTVDSVQPVIGRSIHGDDIFFDLAEALHTGVQGQTRSGKSAFMYNAIAQNCHRSDVMVAGFDPTNVLLPRAKDLNPDMVVLGLADMEAIKELAELLVSILDARLLYLSHMQIDKIEDFSAEMPIIWTIFEETPGLMGSVATADKALKPDQRVGPTLQNCVDRLLMEGAKVGFRVWVLAQRFDANTIGGGGRGQLVRRVSFSVDNGDSVKMLHPAATPLEINQCLEFPAGMGFYQMYGKLDVFKGDYLDYTGYLEAWNPLRRERQHPVHMPPEDDLPPAWGN